MKNKYWFFKRIYKDYVIVFDNNISYGIDKDLIKYIKCKDINYVIVDRECNIKVIECSNNNYYKYVIRESVIKILLRFFRNVTILY